MSNEQDIETWGQLRIVLKSGAELQICCDLDKAEGVAQQLMNPGNGTITVAGKRNLPLVTPATLRIHCCEVAAVDLQPSNKLCYTMTPNTLEEIAHGKR